MPSIRTRLRDRFRRPSPTAPDRIAVEREAPRLVESVRDQAEAIAQDESRLQALLSRAVGNSSRSPPRSARRARSLP
ncbi:MAG: hypothetical protein AAGN64_10655, partial [Bacteroidota bacterium]